MFTLSILPLFSLVFATAAWEPPALQFEPVFADVAFDRPIYLTHLPDGSGRLVVAEQHGRVLIVDPDNASEAIVAIDHTEKVRSPADGGHNEEGLLGLAFHPDFADNGHVFLHYTGAGKPRNVLSRFTMNEARSAIDPDSEAIILQVNQPFGNHNGGMIDFGPDGYLYIALGDGGSANDPRNHGQNRATLLGTILRIDIDQHEGGKPYAIPEDNPFVGDANARPEIWAYGLRNVWRFSFDRETGDLWAGDVGQDKWEEIDLIEKGGNYGWNLREGAHEFRQVASPPDDLIDPIAEYPHDHGKSVTGGYVYRGKAIPQLLGAYIYGDYQSGLIWALRYDRETKQVQGPHVVGHTPEIASFGEDADGELYVVSLPGKIYKVTAK